MSADLVTAGIDTCPTFAPFLGFTGASLCIIMANWGAAWGTWKSGLGICAMGIGHPAGIIKNLVAIIMAGVLGIYGLIVAIIISGGVSAPVNNYNTYTQYTGWAHLAAGLCCGLCCLAAGASTGIAGEIGIRATGMRAELNFANAQRSTGGLIRKEEGGGPGGLPPPSAKGAEGAGPAVAVTGKDSQDEGDANMIYIGQVTILSFSGAIGLYGFIVALIITSSDISTCTTVATTAALGATTTPFVETLDPNSVPITGHFGTPDPLGYVSTSPPLEGTAAPTTLSNPATSTNTTASATTVPTVVPTTSSTTTASATTSPTPVPFAGALNSTTAVSDTTTVAQTAKTEEAMEHAIAEEEPLELTDNS